VIVAEAAGVEVIGAEAAGVETVDEVEVEVEGGRG
jgi:hypothetical protein